MTSLRSLVNEILNIVVGYTPEEDSRGAYLQVKMPLYYFLLISGHHPFVTALRPKWSMRGSLSKPLRSNSDGMLDTDASKAYDASGSPVGKKNYRTLMF